MAKVIEHKIYEFDDFRIDVAHLMLYHRGTEIAMVPKAVETLLALIQRRGKIVSKDELLAAVWPDTVVEESNLFLYLSHLRKTLGTQPDGKPYVETLRRRGYRFNGDVHLVEEEIEDRHYAGVIENHEQNRANLPSQSGRIYLVKDWERNKTEFGTNSSASSALPAVEPFESSTDLTPAKNESVASISPGVEVSQGALEHPESTGLVSDTTGGLRHSKRGYVLPVSLGAILIAAVFAGSFYWRSQRVTTNAGAPKTIAILPFRPLVAADRNEILELGMADALVTRLGNSSNLIVRPLSSVSHFQGPNQDPISAGKALEVESVLEAYIQRFEDRIRVNARLIRVADGTTIWGEPFNEKYTDIFLVQDLIATRIASALTTHLTSDERTRLGKRYTSNTEAYDYYNRGRANVLKITEEGLRKAIGFFDQAIKTDPNYALAYAHQADAYKTFAMAGFASPTEAFPQALILAQKALEIDGSLAEGHLQVAWYDQAYLKDPLAAETRFKRVIEMSPYDFQAHLGYALLLSGTNRHEQAVAEARRARELSPMTPLVFALESQILLAAGQQEQAILQAKKALDFEPNFWVAHLHLGRAYLRQRRNDDALAEFEKANQLAPESYVPQMGLARVFLLKGDHKKADEIVRELEHRRSERFVPLNNLAAIYSGLGDKDKALDLLEKSLDERAIHRINVKTDPLFDNLRSEPRFNEILRRMNLDN